MRCMAGVACGVVAGVVVLSAVPSLGQALPTDPRLVMGELDNGLRYIVLQHANPPERASMWLHVGTGSLNETEPQRGIAHYLEHMAFNGSENFEPGEVVPFFESLGLTFGQHQNAFTSFDQTVYILQLPDAEPETVGKGMLFLSDVALRLTLPPEEIENERQVILEEKRTRLGAAQRVQEYMLERLAPGSIFGRRLPIGVEETITGVRQEDFKDYYGTWYVPSNMTLMVVADADPQMVIKQIKNNFAGEGAGGGGGERAPAPADRDVGVKPYTETRAIVASDPELTNAEVSIMRIDLPREAADTVEEARRDVVEQIATWAFNRRLSAKVAAGTMSFLYGSAGAFDLANAIRLATAQASGEPGQWRRMLADLSTELQRARLHGFTEREIEDARGALLASAEQAVKAEPTRPASAILGEMNEAVAEGEPIMSAAQELELLQKQLPTITAEQVSATFREMFDPTAVTFFLQMPSGAEVPSEEALVEAGREALDVEPASEGEEARPTELLAEKPAPGEVAELSQHEGTGVWSAWLSNNARVHVRPMDYRKDQATITILLAGGEINENANTRGITQAAMLAWDRQATSTLSSTNIRDLMTGKNVRVSGRLGADAVVINVSGNPDDLEAGMQLAYLMLTDPVIEPAAFDQWKQEQLQEIARRKLQPEGVFSEAMTGAIYPPGEIRTKPLEAEHVERQTLPAAEAWLDSILASAPIEVAVVGDIERERALELVRTYVGALPTRERISESTLDEKRKIERPLGPIAADRDYQGQTAKALVLSGFYGTDQDNIRDTRLLSMAGRILSTRMIKQIREEKQLVYSIQANAIPATEYPGFGLLFSFSFTEPAKVPALVEAIDGQFREFSKTGPTPEEMEVAKGQVANQLDEQMREPGFWSARLQSMLYRGTELDDIVEAPGAYQSFTADEVKEAFNRYYKDESMIRITVRPDEAAPAEPGAEGAEEGAPKSN